MYKVRAYLNGYSKPMEYFACWSKQFPATERNYWGGLQSEPITLFANGVDGREAWMYTVIIVPEVDDQVLQYTRRRLRLEFLYSSFANK